ncbi:hypothetical protein AC1031_001740 [Aphanomyces cochlioides]|nr:hypothetical protein AC1031_001740 [Aphanomyces cochlioides]
MEQAPNTPVRRGPYKRTSLSAKKRIVAAANAGGDWASVAEANGVNVSTARGWLHMESFTPKKRGGYKPRLLSNEMVDKMESWVEHDNQITLCEIQARLLTVHHIEVSTTTIHRELDARVFTYKNLHYELFK